MAGDTILVLTARGDVTADAVVDELTRRGTPVVRLDTADFPTDMTMDAMLTARGWRGRITRSSGRVIDVDEVQSVWWRRPGEFRTPTTWSDDARAFAASEARAGLLGVLGSLPVRWINHPAKDAAANYKPRQLAVAACCGLDTPETMITSDRRRAEEFVAGFGAAIYKALGGGAVRTDGSHHAIPTTVVTVNDLDSSIAGTATLLQERVDKLFDVRLTVIGQKMFPVAIHARSDPARLDWRTDYAALDYECVDLPDNVRRGVERLMGEFGLFFGALDFAVTKTGRWMFLEVNANGQWHWLTHQVDLPLVDAMADALSGGSR